MIFNNFDNKLLSYAAFSFCFRTFDPSEFSDMIDITLDEFLIQVKLL